MATLPGGPYRDSRRQRFWRTASLGHPLFLEFDERLERFRCRVSDSPDSQAVGFPTVQV
jgi:hypothetical protein